MQGGFAKCYDVVSLQTQRKYAVKIIEKANIEGEKMKEKLISEIKIHESISHPYIVNFEHYFEDPHHVYILLEKCSNNTLSELIKRRKRLTDIQTKYYIRQLVLAIKYMQNERIIHRDLKLGNLFLSDKLQIKIGDFGLATKLSFNGERKKTKCGTPNYIAPQILDDSKTHSYEVDIWSTGVIAYTLLVGRPPFDSNDVKNTYQKIKSCSYSFPESVSVSEGAKLFIARMLQFDPCRRATADELLLDPFLNENTIPLSLPISSLVSCPSYDFLKKYRDLDTFISLNDNDFAKNLKEQCQKKQNNNFLSLEKKLVKRRSSLEKSLNSTQRPFSACNLVKMKTCKINSDKNNQLKSKSLLQYVIYYQENPKFGLAYLSNNNIVGFSFNDRSQMVVNNKLSKVQYSLFELNQSSPKSIEYTTAEAQEKQTLKYKLLVLYHQKLIQLKTETQSQLPKKVKQKQLQNRHKLVAKNQFAFYVTRFRRISNMIIFWFNKKSMQVIFSDRSQVLVNGSQTCNIITYLNKDGEKTYFQQREKHLQEVDIKKRLAYLQLSITPILMNPKAKTMEDQRQNLTQECKQSKKNQNCQEIDSKPKKLCEPLQCINQNT